MCGWGVGKLFFFFHFSSDLLFQELNRNCLEPGQLLRQEHQQGPTRGELRGGDITRAGSSGKAWLRMGPSQGGALHADPGVLDRRSQ